MPSTFGSEAMDQTTPYSSRKAGIIAWIPVTIMLSVGTGEALTQQVWKHRQDERSRFDYNSVDNGAQSHALVTPAADIAHIRSVLKTSVADLANCIGVSRQSLYNWKSGSNIKSQHLSRLAQLRAAADVLLAENISASPLVLGRKLPGGRTMLEAIAAGMDGYAVATQLVSMLRDEAARRQSLDEQLAARLAAAPKSLDYGVPAFDERS